MLFTLSPLFTAVFSAMAGLRAPRWPERVGIGLGFIGAVLVATARGEVGEPARWTWLLLGLLIASQVRGFERRIDDQERAATSRVHTVQAAPRFGQAGRFGS